MEKEISPQFIEASNSHSSTKIREGCIACMVLQAKLYCVKLWKEW